MLAGAVAAGAALPDAMGLALGSAAAVPLACALAMMELASAGEMVVTLELLAITPLAVEVAAEESVLMTEGAELEPDKLEPDEPLEPELEPEPVRAAEPRSSGMVSMYAIVGPATTLFVAWSRMLFARGCASDVT